MFSYLRNKYSRTSIGSTPRRSQVNLNIQIQELIAQELEKYKMREQTAIQDFRKQQAEMKEMKEQIEWSRRQIQQQQEELTRRRQNDEQYIDHTIIRPNEYTVREREEGECSSTKSTAFYKKTLVSHLKKWNVENDLTLHSQMIQTSTINDLNDIPANAELINHHKELRNKYRNNQLEQQSIIQDDSSSIAPSHRRTTTGQ
jgi:pterin-4a-carbinolamine dehydratase